MTLSDTAPETPKVLTPFEGVWVRQEIDNMGWIDVGAEVLVVDALERPELEGEVMGAIAATTHGKTVRWVLNTHTHYDHVALNPAFVKAHGAEIVNALNTDIPSEGRWFGPLQSGVRMRPFPDCHTAEDCIVHVPWTKTVFVGDLFGWGLIPWDRPLSAAKLEHIVAAYRSVIALDPVTVVPGHGPLCGKAELVRWIDYVTDLVACLRAAAGTEQEKPEPPDDMRHWWRFVDWKHQDTVEKIRSALAKGDL